MPSFKAYVWSLAIWEIVVFGSIAILFVHASREFRAEDVKLFSPVALGGSAIIAICWFASHKRGLLGSILIGALVGSASLVLGGGLWALCAKGFEAPSAILIGSLLLSIPSGIASGIVGYVFHHSVRHTPIRIGPSLN